MDRAECTCGGEVVHYSRCPLISGTNLVVRSSGSLSAFEEGKAAGRAATIAELRRLAEESESESLPDAYQNVYAAVLRHAIARMEQG